MTCISMAATWIIEARLSSEAVSFNHKILYWFSHTSELPEIAFALTHYSIHHNMPFW